MSAGALRSSALSISNRAICCVSAATVLAIGLCVAGPTVAPAEQAQEEEEPVEWLAKPEELAHVPVNDIVKSLRLNGQALKLGRVVYDKSCASCHGADLKGLADQHTPDLTDAEWRFSGDD